MATDEGQMPFVKQLAAGGKSVASFLSLHIKISLYCVFCWWASSICPQFRESLCRAMCIIQRVCHVKDRVLLFEKLLRSAFATVVFLVLNCEREH